jgi:hypothetical protein
MLVRSRKSTVDRQTKSRSALITAVFKHEAKKPTDPSCSSGFRPRRLSSASTIYLSQFLIV